MSGHVGWSGRLNLLLLFAEVHTFIHLYSFMHVCWRFVTLQNMFDSFCYCRCRNYGIIEMKVVHGKSAAEQKMKALERLRRVANNLCLLKDKCLAEIIGFFPRILRNWTNFWWRIWRRGSWHADLLYWGASRRRSVKRYLSLRTSMWSNHALKQERIKGKLN